MTLASTQQQLNANETYPGEMLELRAQSTRYKHLLDVMPTGVVLLDDKGVVIQANQAALDLLGEPLEGTKWINVIARSFDPKADDGHEVSLKDGRRVKLTATPLNDEPGQLILITDLTETRLLQDRVSHMQRLSALGKMIASMAHQIRTPLSAALLYAANLGNKTLSFSAQGQFREKLLSRLRDLEHHVNDMLMFAKSGEQQVVENLSLQSLLTEVQTGSEAMVLQRGGQLDVDLPEPDIIIMGNKCALASAIQNLVHNSIHVSGDGAYINISANRCDVDPNKVLLSVEDNGPGISQEHQQKIFEPFFTTQSQGTGLGLAVVHAVAKSHQGSVHVSSILGQGAKFTITLPIAKVEQGVEYPLYSESGA